MIPNKLKKLRSTISGDWSNSLNGLILATVQEYAMNADEAGNPNRPLNDLEKTNLVTKFDEVPTYLQRYSDPVMKNIRLSEAEAESPLEFISDENPEIQIKINELLEASERMKVELNNFLKAHYQKPLSSLHELMIIKLRELKNELSAFDIEIKEGEVTNESKNGEPRL